ncbi:MAG TPA: hypothetical protein VN602_10415 [Gemmatimonadaceae bacterium]|nr:hypothetical protein [Gemmatimonadaceae bacterium]
MIESRFWRKELRADIAWLRRHRRFKRWSEGQQVLFERGLMMVAFQVRVLLEHSKVDGKVGRTTIKAQFFPKIGDEPVTWMNALDFHDHFDVDNPRNVTLSIRDVCNQLIHHYVMFAFGRGFKGFEQIVVFSDYHKNTGMYEMNAEALIELFARFAHESSHAHYTQMIWNEKRRDYEFSTDPEPEPVQAVT